MNNNYMVFDVINGEYTFHATYEDALKRYESAKEYHFEGGCSGEETVYLFETKKFAYLVEDTDRKENPEEYGYDFWVKWQETDYLTEEDK